MLFLLLFHYFSCLRVFRNTTVLSGVISRPNSYTQCFTRGSAISSIIGTAILGSLCVHDLWCFCKECSYLHEKCVPIEVVLQHVVVNFDTNFVVSAYALQVEVADSLGIDPVLGLKSANQTSHRRRSLQNM